MEQENINSTEVQDEVPATPVVVTLKDKVDKYFEITGLKLI